MKFFFKSIIYILLIFFIVIAFFILNLFTKPFSIDHNLNKELTIELLESPEYMTYIGIFDKFNFIFKHKEKLTIPSEKNQREILFKKIKASRFVKKV